LKLQSHYHLVVFVLSIVLASGCGSESLVTGKVTGIVSKRGEPMAGLSVLFMPEGAGSKSGPPAGAITDKNGRYSLAYSLPNNSDLSSPHVDDGCIVGWHKVTLADFKMMEEMLPPPGRVPAAYLETASSPLRFEVKVGEQAIDIDIE
jgi:hypothetical protein